MAAGIVFRSSVLAFGQEAKGSSSPKGFHIPYEAQLDPVFFFTRATFEPYVGGIFTTRGLGGGTVELTLVSIHDWNPKPAPVTRQRKGVPVAQATFNPTDCFSLLFRASGPLPELSTVYRLNHAALGEFDLFMTQSKDEHGQLFYEAVINHLTQ
jgi:hypothetical protein